MLFRETFLLALIIYGVCAQFSKYFNKAQISNGKVVVDHKWIQVWDIDNAWKQLDANQRLTRFKNYQSIKVQFDCHVRFAPLKNPWNLETWRNETNWWKVVMNGCNPKR